MNMGLLELIMIAVGLSMDAFAVSIGKGLSQGRISLSCALCCGGWFGLFQAAMPLCGYFLGSIFSDAIGRVDHWVAFGLLAFIGVKTIFDGVRGGEDKKNSSLSFVTMLISAIATSIDALAVGIALSLLDVNIYLSVALIGAVTFAISFIGALLGGALGKVWQKNAQIFGGVVLVAIGLKILIEHLIEGK